MNRDPRETLNQSRVIINYLQAHEDGATVSDVMQHLNDEHTFTQSDDELNKTVESILTEGTTLGFLERKGSRFLNWVAKDMCCLHRRIKKVAARLRRRRRRCPPRRRRRRRCKCRCG